MGEEIVQRNIWVGYGAKKERRGLEKRLNGLERGKGRKKGGDKRLFLTQPAMLGACGLELSVRDRKGREREEGYQKLSGMCLCGTKREVGVQKGTKPVRVKKLKKKK